MEKFIIPVQRVEMSGEDFDATRKAIMDLEFENDHLKTQLKQLETFISRITSIMNYKPHELEIITSGSDYDVYISQSTISDRPIMGIREKQVK